MTGYAAAFEWAKRQVDAGRLPTAVVGIATSQGTVALEAFGATGSRTATVDDHYRIFSITKPLVGIVAARAIERGLLTPDTPLSAALPSFGANRDDIVRLRHLVSHTSGISEPSLAPEQPLRDLLVNAGRDFAAGTASRYSTVAFEGIAAMTEHVTGVDWAVDASAWAATVGADGFTLDEASDPHEVRGMAEAGMDLGRFVAARNPGAGLIARAGDLLALGSELLRIGDGADGIVRSATLAMMRRPLTGAIPRLDPYPAERGQDWGFTFNLRSRAPGLIDTDAYGHGGWAGTEFWVHPTAGVAWVLMTNQAPGSGIDTDELDNAVISAL